MSIGKFFNKNAYNIFLVGLVLLNVVPWLAPIFMQLGWHGPAKVIYRIYSVFCHQIGWRSLHVYDHQCAWCSRDTAIWGSFLLVAFIVKYRKISGFKWYWVFPFALPMALDGGIQLIATLFSVEKDNDPFYVSTNFSRIVTGTLFGTGLGMTLLPDFFSTTKHDEKDSK